MKFNVNSDDFEMPPDNDPMWAALERESINDSKTVSRPEDPRIDEAGNEPAPAPGLDKLKESIRDFVRREYDDDLDEDAFDNSSCIGIAETNVEDREDIVIDVAVNIPDRTLDMYINGERTDTWQYSSLLSMAIEIDRISFDELVSLGPEAELRVQQLTSPIPLEHDFLRNPEDAYALYQLRHTPAHHLLMFTGMDELKNEAKRFREAIHKAAERLEDDTFGSKKQLEDQLRDMGMTVIPNEDACRITLQNDFMMKGDILLGYGDGICWTDGCDTRGLDEPVYHDKYNLVYTGPVDGSRKPEQILNELYEEFNLNHPPHFKGHSMSVGDVVVLMQNGQTTAYFCDNIGFTKLQNFLADQPLRNAEIQLEDDYNMIDGIINNGPRQEDKPSLRAQLDGIRIELDQSEHPHLPKARTNQNER